MSQLIAEPQRESVAKKKPDEQKRVRDGYNLQGYLPEELGAALERFLDHFRPRIKKTAALEMAIEKLLTEYGYWPPPPTP